MVLRTRERGSFGSLFFFFGTGYHECPMRYFRMSRPPLSEKKPVPVQSRPDDVSVRRSSAGLGLFANRGFRNGETVIEYVGDRVRSRKESSRVNRYLFSVNARWDIDGSPRWNVARYANHSCRPNCEAVNRRGRTLIVARRRIRPGEELTYDYGQDYFDAFIRPNGCRCLKCAPRIADER